MRFPPKLQRRYPPLVPQKSVTGAHGELRSCAVKSPNIHRRSPQKPRFGPNPADVGHFGATLGDIRAAEDGRHRWHPIASYPSGTPKSLHPPRETADLKAEQSTTFAVTADMARQYKALQEELIFKINSLETQLTEQKEELDIKNHELTELIRNKDEDIEDKDKQIQLLDERMADMSREFASMLTETLDLMRTQIGEKLKDTWTLVGILMGVECWTNLVASWE